MRASANESEPSPFLPVQAFCERFRWPGERTLRHWIFSDPAGFNARCVRRVGRSVVLDVAAVWAWVDECGPGMPAARGGLR